ARTQYRTESTARATGGQGGVAAPPPPTHKPWATPSRGIATETRTESCIQDSIRASMARDSKESVWRPSPPAHSGDSGGDEQFLRRAGKTAQMQLRAINPLGM